MLLFDVLVQFVVRRYHSFTVLGEFAWYLLVFRELEAARCQQGSWFVAG